MNKPMKCLPAIGAAGALLLAGAGPAVAERSLIYSTYLPSTHSMVVESVIPYFRRVEKDTGGSIKFEVSAGGALVSAKETLGAIRDKAIDGGFVVPSYVPAALPESAMLVDLALLTSDPMVVTGAVNETLLLDCPECMERFRSNNLQPIGVISSTAYLLLCKPAIKTAADIKGKRIRSTSSWGVWSAAVGAIPVNVPSGETYEALQRGQADCTFGNIGHLINYSLGDVVTNITDMPVGTYYGSDFLNIRADIWQELSAAEKKALIDNAPQALIDALKGYFDVDKAAEEIRRSKRINLITPNADLVELHNSFKPVEIERVLKQARESGKVKNPQKIIEAFTANLDKWEKIVEEIKGDMGAFRDALGREIYSKVPM